MIKIKGQYSEDNKNSTPGEWTAEEITNLLKNEHRGMISFQNVFGSYTINGMECSATGVSIGDETFVFERDGKIVIPTFFSRDKIRMEGNPEEIVKVDVIIDPEANPLYVHLVKGVK